MRLRRISENLINKYNKRRKFSLIGVIVSSAIILTIIILSVTGVISGIYYSLIYVALGLLLFTLKCLGYYLRLCGRKSVINNTRLHDYMDITSRGISIEIDDNGIVETKVYTWSKLNTIKGYIFDIGFFKNKPLNYKIAFISDGRQKEMPESLRKASTPRQIRKAINENKEFIEEQDRNFEPYGVLVEMYDEMVNEIKKYWKKV